MSILFLFFANVVPITVVPFSWLWQLLLLLLFFVAVVVVVVVVVVVDVVVVVIVIVVLLLGLLFPTKSEIFFLYLLSAEEYLEEV